MNFETIIYETDGPLAFITLNRPEKLNAMNQIMVEELKAAMDLAQLNDDVRVIIVRGAGRAFSSGLDIDPTDSEGMSKEQQSEALKAELKNDFDMIMRFWDSPKPTIAAVHTYCLGGAMELAMACDITIAARECRFGEPEVTFGSGVVALLMRYVCGPTRANHLLLTATHRISTERAEAWGIVNRVDNPKKQQQRARQMAMDIARNDQHAVRVTKQAINNSYEIGRMRDALKHALELDIAIEITETDESREFNEILRNEGAKAAIDWRERKLGYVGQVKRHEIG